jgi:hypothetical protein
MNSHPQRIISGWQLVDSLYRLDCSIDIACYFCRSLCGNGFGDGQIDANGNEIHCSRRVAETNFDEFSARAGCHIQGIPRVFIIPAKAGIHVFRE